jgi:TRAP-type C4-dicarboxylate transport system permease small subunit
MELLRRIDRAWARAEGWLTVGVLILMVLVAGFQAFVRNLTRFDVEWANRLLTDMDWADSLLRKATLWLAFLGASLAAHKHKHIGVDILIRFAPPKPKYVILAMGGILTGVIALGMTKSFADAVHLNLTERPIEYEMLGDEGSMHVCDATPEQLAQLQDFERPSVFCAFRAGLGLFGVPAETPGAAFQLIVPLMLFAIGLRFFAYGLGYAMTVMGGAEAIDTAEAQAQAQIQAQRQSLAPPPATGDAGGGAA